MLRRYKLAEWESLVHLLMVSHGSRVDSSTSQRITGLEEDHLTSVAETTHFETDCRSIVISEIPCLTDIPIQLGLGSSHSQQTMA